MQGLFKQLHVPMHADWNLLVQGNVVYVRVSPDNSAHYVGATEIGLLGRELSRIRKFSQRWLTYLEPGMVFWKQNKNF